MHATDVNRRHHPHLVNQTSRPKLEFILGDPTGITAKAKACKQAMPSLHDPKNDSSVAKTQDFAQLTSLLSKAFHVTCELHPIKCRWSFTAENIHSHQASYVITRNFGFQQKPHRIRNLCTPTEALSFSQLKSISSPMSLNSGKLQIH